MNITLYPGKKLTVAEETWLYARIDSLKAADARNDSHSSAARREWKSLERYLPQNEADWSPDALEGGAHVGPWTDFSGSVDS